MGMNTFQRSAPTSASTEGCEVAALSQACADERTEKPAGDGAQRLIHADASGWLTENLTALQSSNSFVEQHGLPLARYRPF
jgi:hypothetical protein